MSATALTHAEENSYELAPLPALGQLGTPRELLTIEAGANGIFVGRGGQGGGSSRHRSDHRARAGMTLSDADGRLSRADAP